MRRRRNWKENRRGGGRKEMLREREEVWKEDKTIKGLMGISGRKGTGLKAKRVNVKYKKKGKKGGEAR